MGSMSTAAFTYLEKSESFRIVAAIAEPYLENVSVESHGYLVRMTYECPTRTNSFHPWKSISFRISILISSPTKAGVQMRELIERISTAIMPTTPLSACPLTFALSSIRKSV